VFYTMVSSELLVFTFKTHFKHILNTFKNFENVEPSHICIPSKQNVVHKTTKNFKSTKVECRLTPIAILLPVLVLQRI
jgi:hypothetical protein